MENYSDFLAQSLVIGIGATIVMDLWAATQHKVLGVPSLNYALVGRWIAGMPSGEFRLNPVSSSASAPYEKTIGWSAHYLIGIVFAAVLLSFIDFGWAELWLGLSCIGVGLVTVAFPFLIMQPSFGLGIAASRTPQPNTVRFRSLVAHFSFGVGLYVAVSLSRFLWI